MPPTVRGLLRQPALLVTLVGAGPGIDEPISWVHSSDLPDPTPFLESGQLLLTTGTQFPASAGRDFYDNYVRRLAECGVVAVGFGTEVVRSGTPSELGTACAREGIPLIEVPYITPFIAVIRWAADILAREARARDDWSLAAQHAISVAAVGPGGLSAALSALGDQLGSRVAVLDDAGALADRIVAPNLTSAERKLLAASALELLRRGRRAASTVDLGGETALLQTLGAGAQLSGVLAVIGKPPDAAAISVITSVVALAEMSFQRDMMRNQSVLRLHREVLELMLGGFGDMIRGMMASLPTEPISIALCANVADADQIEDGLAQLSAESGMPYFVAPRGDQIVVLVEERHQPELERFLRAGSMKAGLGGSGSYAELAAGLARARLALRAALRTKQPVAVFSELPEKTFVEALAGSGIGELAEIQLAPILAQSEGSAMIRQCRTWLTLNGHWDSAARVLGIHRHTLKARVHQLFHSLGLDPDAFDDRVRLWVLLNALNLSD